VGALAEKQNIAAWGELACRVGKSALEKKAFLLLFALKK
jgi:hypothetical protein